MEHYLVIHWPVAFVPGRGLFPDHPSKKGYAEIDLETSLVETWKAMIALPKTKVCHCVRVLNTNGNFYITIRSNP